MRLKTLPKLSNDAYERLHSKLRHFGQFKLRWTFKNIRRIPFVSHTMLKCMNILYVWKIGWEVTVCVKLEHGNCLSSLLSLYETYIYVCNWLVYMTLTYMYMRKLIIIRKYIIKRKCYFLVISFRRIKLFWWFF